MNTSFLYSQSTFVVRMLLCVQRAECIAQVFVVGSLAAAADEQTPPFPLVVSLARSFLLLHV